jgi:hypothetical protein
MCNKTVLALAAIAIGMTGSLTMSMVASAADPLVPEAGMVNYNNFNLNGVDPASITIPGSGSGGSIEVNGPQFENQLVGFQNAQYMWNNNQNNNDSVLTNVLNNTSLGSINVQQSGNSFQGEFLEPHTISSGTGAISASTAISSNNSGSDLSSVVDSHVDVSIANGATGDIKTGDSGGNASLMNVSAVNVGNNINNSLSVDLTNVTLGASVPAPPAAP